MLFTRCPHCNTTFRITPEALNKAHGQVRCGRCVNIFNAHTALREAAEAPESAEESIAPHAPPPASETSQDDAPAPPAPPHEAETLDATALDETAREDDIDTLGPQRPSTAADVTTHAPVSSMSSWPPEEAEASSDPTRRRAWAAAAAVSLLVLLGQVTHHFRDQFANQPLIGPIVQVAYAVFGAPVTPRWDIEQYRILDWVAAAEQDPNGRGDLTIRARIQNSGPAAQPFPYVLVQLKDRWESAIGSRVFAPHEYLSDAPSTDALMPSGHTANAALTLVDPGPDAYGFEIDVCIEYGAEQLRCATDRIFR